MNIAEGKLTISNDLVAAKSKENTLAHNLYVEKISHEANIFERTMIEDSTSPLTTTNSQDGVSIDNPNNLNMETKNAPPATKLNHALNSHHM